MIQALQSDFLLTASLILLSFGFILQPCPAMLFVLVYFTNGEGVSSLNSILTLMSTIIYDPAINSYYAAFGDNTQHSGMILNLVATLIAYLALSLVNHCLFWMDR